MNPHVFATVRFSRAFNPAVQRSITEFMGEVSSKLQLAVYASAEQKGVNPETRGVQSHLHFVALDVLGSRKYNQLEALTKRLFPNANIQQERVNAFRAKHLITSFLRHMNRKGRSPEEKQTTRKWREVHDIPSSYRTNNVLNKIKDI